MSALDTLAKGDKIDCHLLIDEHALAIIDEVAGKHNISRAAVVQAWAVDYEAGLFAAARYEKTPRKARAKGKIE